MVFFADRDLGAEVFPQILKESGITLERHIDHFPQASPDEEWLKVVAERGWFVLTNDKGILSRHVERDVVMSHGIGLFILVGGHLTGRESARNFVNTIQRVQSFIERHERPFIAKIYRPSPLELVAAGEPGRVVLKYPHPDSEAT